MKNTIRNAIIIAISVFATVLAVIDPSNYYFIRLGTGFHFTISLTGAILLLILLVKKQINSLTLHLNRIDLILLLFAGYLGVRYVLSPDYRVFPDKIIRYYSCLIFYIVYRIPAQKHRIKTAYYALYSILGFGVLQSLYALLQWFGILPNLFNYRLGGTFGNPGDLANVLVIPYAISLGLLLKTSHRIQRRVLLGTTLLITTIIGLSLARTAWIAVGIITVILLWNRYSEGIKRIYQKVALPVWITSGFVALLICIWVAVKLFQFKHDSAYGRIFIWERCVELITEKPVFGHGYESFITRYNQAQAAYFQNHPNDVKNGLIADDNFFAFNDFLQYAVEYGITGFLLLLGVLYFAIQQPSCFLKNNSISSVLNAGFLGLIVCMSFSYPLQNLSIQCMVVLLIAIRASLQNRSVFSIHLSPSMRRILSLPVLILLVISIGSSVTFIRYGFKWKKAYVNYKQHNPVVFDQYQQLIPVLKYDRSFLYNYGTMLHAMGKYEDCLRHFEKFPNILWTTDLLLVVADCYDQTRNYREAEACYREVSNLKPHLFVPKYKLFKLYQRTNERVKAIDTAHEIQSMEIKVNSKVVMTIKNEINKFLLANTQ